MTYFLVNRKFPASFAEKLSLYGEILPVPDFSLLDFPVNAHPDMLAVNVGGTLFIHEKNTSLAKMLERYDIPFSCTQDEVGGKYPKDVSLNLFTSGKSLFANEKHASRDVLEFAKENGYAVANVAQGYAKCSAMLVGEAIVTADSSIYRSALLWGVDALLISAGYVGIEKYDTGFIGGASGTVCPGKVAVFGNIATHPDGEKISAFAEKHNTEIISLGEGKLFDYGGIVRVDT